MLSITKVNPQSQSHTWRCCCSIFSLSGCSVVTFRSWPCCRTQLQPWFCSLVLHFSLRPSPACRAPWYSVGWFASGCRTCSLFSICAWFCTACCRELTMIPFGSSLLLTPVLYRFLWLLSKVLKSVALLLVMITCYSLLSSQCLSPKQHMVP